jgi:hypothetical protein
LQQISISQLVTDYGEASYNLDHGEKSQENCENCDKANLIIEFLESNCPKIYIS